MLWAAIGVLLLAFFLLFMELMVPSFGTLAVASLVAFGTAVALAFLHGTPTGFIFVGIVVVGVPLGIYLGVKAFKLSPMGRRMILAGPTQDLAGGAATARVDLVGKEGVARSILRPSGIAEVGGRRLDVIAEGRFVEPGERIRVVKVDGNRIVVEPVQEA